MNYQDAVAILSDPFSIISNAQRKRCQRSRHAVLASGGTVVRVFYPEENKVRYALSDIKPKAPGEKLAGKLRGANIFQLSRWTRGIRRKIFVVSRKCELPGVPAKVRALLYAKKSQLIQLQAGLLGECQRRGIA